MLWILSFHLIAMVCWFSAIFYLPRLYVYHAQATDELSRTRFKTMERRLYYGIMTPSGVATALLGSWLFSLNHQTYLASGWFHAKLTLVMILWAYHLYCGYLLKKFRDDKNVHSSIFYRWLNEIPVILLSSIIILAVVKPF